MKLQEAVGKNFWLSEDELHVELSNLDGWKEDDGYIVKRYQFEAWKKITKFMKILEISIDLVKIIFSPPG